jgi:hypothetical protein
LTSDFAAQVRLGGFSLGAIDRSSLSTHDFYAEQITVFNGYFDRLFVEVVEWATKSDIAHNLGI